ncbi:ankyrin [Hyaloscypha variabilis F]|uniref:Ankyrin n=1 Tax=Hyaloscypha variabilis (strain UAMH 11265 / GT02V1 / F) TaxID=1149755 RepID=A0A2J6RNV9_HYAVF|nr:ankyrin [Hyaloscypha variabilis F]
MPAVAVDQDTQVPKCSSGRKLRHCLRSPRICIPCYLGWRGRWALNRAAMWGDIKTVKRLLECGANPNHYEHRSNIFDVEALMAPTPLRAAVHSRLEITQLLIRYGANVNLRDVSRVTVLHKAATDGRVDIIHELLRHGADVNAKDIYGETPLAGILKRYFNRLDNLDAIPILLQNGASLCKMADWDSPHAPQGWSRIGELIDMSAEGRRLLEVLRTFFVKFKAGESENEWLDSMKDLHLACLQIEGDKDVIVTTLLNMDIEVNTKDVTGLTALEYAAIGGTKKTLTKLLRKGVDIHCVDQYGATLLHRAVFAERIDLIEMLLAEGEDINIKISLSSTQAAALVDDAGRSFAAYATQCQLTPLQLAILGNRRKSVNILLKHKASLEPFAYPRMPIHFPAARHGMDFFQQVLEAGASTDLGDVSLAAALSVGHDKAGAFTILKTYTEQLGRGEIPPDYPEGLDSTGKAILDLKGKMEEVYVSKVFFWAKTLLKIFDE